MKTYDVFRHENRAGGRRESVGEFDAQSPEEAVEQARQQFADNSLHSFTAETSTRELADLHEEACYEDEGEAACGREE